MILLLLSPWGCKSSGQKAPSHSWRHNRATKGPKKKLERHSNVHVGSAWPYNVVHMQNNLHRANELTGNRRESEDMAVVGSRLTSAYKLEPLCFLFSSLLLSLISSIDKLTTIVTIYYLSLTLRADCDLDPKRTCKYCPSFGSHEFWLGLLSLRDQGISGNFWVWAGVRSRIDDVSLYLILGWI